jgi:hypothetical protein
LIAHSSWLWLAPRPACGSAIVFNATLRMVLSSTMARRLMMRTLRIPQRRRKIVAVSMAPFAG